MGKDGGNYEFFAGKEATEYVWWDGDNLNVKGIITVTSGSNVEAGADVTDYTVNNTDANLTTGTTIDAGGVYIAGTAGKFTVSKTSNTIDYDAADAVFLGVHGSTGNEKPKLSLKGGASDGYLKWDGAALSIKGSITITGWSDSGDVAGIAAAQSTASSAASAASAAQSDATQAIGDAAGAQGTADGKVTTFFENDAPTAEGVGDLWMDTNDGNKLYRWNGSSWAEIQDDAIAQAISDASDAQSTADGKIVTFYQNEAPTATSIGDLWVDTNDGNKLYRASAAGSANWVTVQDTSIAAAQSTASQAISDASGAQGTADGKVTTFFQNEPPTSEGIGDLWLDTNDGNKLYRATVADSSTDWTEVQDDGIAQAISDASDAQSTADGKIVSFYQTEAPTATSVGDLWVDTNDGNKLYRATATGTGNWVEVQDDAIATAQGAANDAQDAADDAQTAADDAQDAADEAKDDLADIADDDKVTPDEKLSAKVLYDKIINEYSGIIAQALAQGVSSTAYTTDYDALVLYIGTTISVFSSMSATTDITRSDWTTKWGDYYTEKQTLLNAIVADAESKADAAQSDADDAQSAAEAAAGTAAARATTFRQDDVPDANAIGDIWYDTNAGNKMYVSASATADSIDPGEWELFSPSLAVLTYDAPEGEGSGLYMDDTHLGYYTDSGSYDASNWKTYMQSNGNFYLDGAGGGLSWVAASSTLIIQGDITADDGYIGTTTGWHINSGNIENGKVKLDAANELIKVGFVDNFTISGTDSGILMGKESGSGAGTNYDFFAGKKDGNYIHWDASEGRLNITGDVTITNTDDFADPDADVTADEIAADTTLITGNQTTYDSSDFKLGELAADTPTGEGLFMSATNLGYYNNGAWQTYMGASGAFYLGGSSGSLTWDGSSALYVKGQLVADTGYIGGTGGWQIATGTITGSNIVMNSNGTISTSQWSLNNNGSASFANGGITFAANGDITSNEYLVERSRLFGAGSDGDITIHLSGYTAD